MRLAWAHRDRLGPREQVFLKALAGPRYPEHPQSGERIQAWEDAVRQVPDDPDMWINLGDAYFHDGAVAGVEEPLRRAAEALNRALALDSTLNVEPMIHLLQIASMERDTATVRRLINRIPEDAPASALLRLQAGAILGDSAMLTAARPEFDSTGSVIQIMGRSRELRDRDPGSRAQRGSVPEAVEAGAQSACGRSSMFSSSINSWVGPPRLRPALAQSGPKEAIPTLPMLAIIVHALYGYGDTTAAAEAVARLAPSADGPVARDPAAREWQYETICAVEWWRLAHGDTRTARAAIARLAGGKAAGAA